MIALLRRLLYVLRRSRRGADLHEEMEAHRAHRQDALEREGLAPDAAARASRRALGNVTLAHEDADDVWAVRAIDHVRQDVRAAVRGLRSSPGFAAVAVGTLALAIGANTALFSIFNSLTLRPLPVASPSRLAVLTDGSWSYPVWQQISARATTLFDDALAWANERFDLSGGGATIPVDGAYVSGRFFEALGISTVRGRPITPDDDRGAATDEPVAVISYRLWHQQFAGADDVVGRRISIQRVPITIVGVMPPGFFGVEVGRRMDVVIPFAAEPRIRGKESWLADPNSSWVEMMVRLKPGHELAQADAALRAVQPQIREATIAGVPSRRAARYLTQPFTLAPAATGRSSLRTRFETPLFAMVVAVGLVLLVACANIAGLFVARALGRRRELSVRLALGGSRRRIAQLLFTESCLVAMAGAALGLVFAAWSSALLVQQLTTWQDAVALDVVLDTRVLAFTAMLASLSAVVAGVAPVLGLKSVPASDALKDAGRSIAGDRRFRVRGTLVVAQIAVSLVLVVVAGLCLRTFAALTRLPLGFVPGPLLVAELDLGASGAPIERRGPLVARLQDAARAVPGVRSASVSAVMLLTGGGMGSNRIAIDDGPIAQDDRSENRLWLNLITPGWFETMGTPLVQGRDFTDDDRLGSPLVAVVNQAFVRRYQLGEPPLGRTVRVGTSTGETRYHIVGLVGDAVYTSPRDGLMATMYLPIAQGDPRAFRPTMFLTVNTVPGQRSAVQRRISAALERAEPTVAFTVRTFDDVIDATVTQERLVALLSAFFGGLALLLAGIGLYGVVAQAVRARRTEIGLRLALGARPAEIVRLVVRGVGVLIVAGLAVGLAASPWAAQLVAPVLFQVEARDPTSLWVAAGGLVLTGVLAAWLPARRAARLDPATLLRNE
jgi:predicted permease